MRRLALFLACFAAFSMLADAREEVRNAELSFAKAFADRDSSRFFAMILDDASFLGPAGTLTGKKAVMERWSHFFASPRAPFRWTPERVAVNAAGTIGLTAGPVFDLNGHHIGNFNSTWIKQADGTWKILFDGPGGAPACIGAVPASEGDITTADRAKLHFRKIGEGRNTLIAPLELYDRLAPLADVATIIAFGPSTNADDVETVRRHFNIDKFVPVNDAEYAKQHPEHVARVLTVRATDDPLTAFASIRASLRGD